MSEFTIDDWRAWGRSVASWSRTLQAILRTASKAVSRDKDFGAGRSLDVGMCATDPILGNSVLYSRRLRWKNLPQCDRGLEGSVFAFKCQY